MDPKKAAGGIAGFFVKPLEGLAALALIVSVIGGGGVWAGLWTERQAIAFVAPPLEASAHFFLMILAPFADFAVIIGLAYFLHSAQKAIAIVVGAGIVAFISWHFGGQDWIGGVLATIGHPGAGR